MDGSLISDEDRRYRCLSRGLLCLASGGGGGGGGYWVTWYIWYIWYIYLAWTVADSGGYRVLLDSDKIDSWISKNA